MSAVVEKIARYREILQSNPQSRVYVPLADLLQKTGDTDEALTLLEDGLSRNPDHQAAMVVLGRTLLQAGRQGHGIKVLQRVLDLSPDNFVVLRILVEDFLAKDEFVEALPLLERLTSLEPEHSEWQKLLGDVRQRMVPRPEKNENANASLAGEGLATMTLVDIMVAQGYLDKALAALQRMTEADPTRKDVISKIEQIRSSMNRAPKKTDKVDPSSGEDDLSAENRKQLRAAQKAKFNNWIGNQNNNQGERP
ncbi:MAG: tetratricopeptide repeat protein [bacterium]|nr:tetratricopeptide repeat protein [bacterium]